MPFRRFLPIAVIFLLSACGADEPTSGDPTPAEQTGPAGQGQEQPASPAPDSPSPAVPDRAISAPVSDAQAGAIGISECDNFLIRYQRCMTHRVPEEMRGGMQTALDSWRGTWSTMAASPTTRGGLAQTCTAAADSVRAQLVAYGCAL